MKSRTCGGAGKIVTFVPPFFSKGGIRFDKLNEVRFINSFKLSKDFNRGLVFDEETPDRDYFVNKKYSPFVKLISHFRFCSPLLK
jgi:hypothetical protein